LRQRVEKRRLADIRQADNAHLEAHERSVRSRLLRCRRRPRESAPRWQSCRALSHRREIDLSRPFAILATRQAREATAMSTPLEYMRRYTSLSGTDPQTGLTLKASVSGYGSGWVDRGHQKGLGPAMQMEFQYLKNALIKTFCPGKKSLDSMFYAPAGKFPFLQPSEPFWTKSLINALVGKGSPDELTDTLRLAAASGRIGTTKDAAGQSPAAPTASAYSDKLFTLDCNGLVGNFHGFHCSIDGYSSPAKRRKEIGDVAVGDVLVTHCADSRYEHVALIAGWKPLSGNEVEVSIVEWGTKGDESKHYKESVKFTVTRGPEASFGVGWKAKSYKGIESFRYIFAPPAKAGEEKGWWT
jgi:hypothetical protein